MCCAAAEHHQGCQGLARVQSIQNPPSIARGDTHPAIGWVACLLEIPCLCSCCGPKARVLDV
ncbi:hypothetical protein B0H67DRAFT_561926 [Lasiosphaeris hirsuta]|uniref:Uncharacterized protein n=1 Tax=Lasiosphaeris hirsuta TaxID=260670 RepID=A0AA40BAD0_9PEZI|nr:hypothetical protein B0H67DRAFT_561926 [Lasiosphaeris hirsuta]